MKIVNLFFLLGFTVPVLADLGTTDISIVNKTKEKIVAKQPKKTEFVKRSHKDGRGDRIKEDFVGYPQIIVEPGATKKIVTLGRDQYLYTSGQLVDVVRYGKAELIRTSISFEIERYGTHVFESEWTAKKKGSSSRLFYSGEKVRGTNLPYQRVYDGLGVILKISPKFKLPYWDIEMVFFYPKPTFKERVANFFKKKK